MKAERVSQLELLLRSHPEGLRRAEIARRLGVHRSTISRYVDALKDRLDIVEEHNLIKLKEDNPSSPLELSIYESLAFNLSAEALSNTNDMLNSHLATGLRKIGNNMRQYAPNISKSLLDLADSIENNLILTENESDNDKKIMETLIDSWVSGRIARIFMKNGDEAEIALYFIGFKDELEKRKPITVTGRLRHTKEIATVDINDISRVQMLNETYTIPDNLKPFKIKNREDYDAIDMIPLTLLIDEKSALNSFSTLIKEEPEIYRLDGGKSVCKIKIENSYELLLRIIQSGKSIVVLEPKEYREKIIHTLEGILSLYK